MMAWVRPVEYVTASDGQPAIIMNRENSYEYGLQADTGALHGAFSPCWRWYGTVRIPAHEWTHTAMEYDGAAQIAFVSGAKVPQSSL